MAAMMATHYHAAHGAHYGYVAPPTPPMDETRSCSLPSISNLLGLADHGSPTTETSPSSFHSHSRPNSSHNAAAAASMMTARLPLTPPMSSYDSYHSPSSKPVSQLPPTAGPGYYFDMEAEARQMVPRMAMQPASYQPQFAAPAYAVPSYYPTMQPTPPPQGSISGLFYQRPLPQNFPPLPMSMSMGGPGTNPWQHHHYIAPSAASSYQQSQDRYICQTCGKAFSRPSSLRIHGHSHTGEKPFKCPHPGCGKAFSVRSNMKRHERGCHNFETSSTSGSSSVGA